MKTAQKKLQKKQKTAKVNQNSEKSYVFLNKYLYRLTVFYLRMSDGGWGGGGGLIRRWTHRLGLSRAAGTSELQGGRGTAGTRTPPAPGTQTER